jgi:Winged helix DNA-binding domain
VKAELPITALRLRNQKLVASDARTPAEIVSWLGAVQSQDYAGAQWALGLRLPGLTDADIDRAFNDGTIVRTHILRPTWHFVAPEDIRWIQKLTGPRVQRQSESYHRKVGLDQRAFARSRRVLESSLRDGRHLTRAALGAVFTRARVSVDGLRLAFLMMQAELDLVICSGPRQGKQFTYALLDERVPRAKRLDGEEALSELVRRYFQSHGPATVHDFVWWSGLTVAQTKAGLAALGREVESRELNGLTYWSMPSARRPSGADGPIVHLLPIYDEYLNALRDRSLARDPSAPTPTVADFVGSPNQLLIDGVLRGAWKRDVTSRQTRIVVKPFRPLNRKELRALKDAGAAYSAFLGQAAALSIV